MNSRFKTMMMVLTMVITALAFTGIVLDADESDAASSTISISVGSGNGTINLYDSSHNLVASTSSSTPATYTFSVNSNFTYEAVASDGWQWDRWTASWSIPQNNPQTVTMSANGVDKTVVAYFVESASVPTTKVTVYVNTGSGSITATDGTNTITATSSTPVVGYLQQGTITISATPSSNYTFNSLYGMNEGSSTATGSSSSTITNSLGTTNRIYYANFSYDPPAPTNPSVYINSRTGGSVTLSVTSSGSTVGTVSSGNTNTFSLSAGTNYTLTATPNQGYYFAGWTTGPSQTPNGGNESITFTPSGTNYYYYYANWTTTAPIYSFTINAGSGGTVTVSIPGQSTVTIPTDGSQTFNAERNTVITATANANLGYAFRDWLGDLGTDNNSATNSWTLDSNGTVTARWGGGSTHSFYLRVDLGGYVTATINGTTYTVQGGLADHWTVNAGTQVTVKAYPDTGNEFYAWAFSNQGSWDYSLTNTEYTFTVNTTGLDYLATWKYPFKVTSLAGGSVEVISEDVVLMTVGPEETDSVMVLKNTMLTLSAVPDQDYFFLRWMDADNHTETSNPFFVTARTVPLTYTAMFTNGMSVSIQSNNLQWGTVTQNMITGIPLDSTISVNNNMITINGTTVTALPTESNILSNYAFDGWTVEGLVLEDDTPVENGMVIRANFTYAPTGIGEVWWSNGYDNGSVEIAFDFTATSNVTHTMIIPLLTYDGIEDDNDGIEYFSENGYILTITNGYNRDVTCTVFKPNGQSQTYTPFKSGYWTQYIFKIDVQNGKISFAGINSPYRDPGMDFSFVNYKTYYETEIFDISDNVNLMAFERIYHIDSGTGDHPHFQVSATTTWLKTYGFVMVDPTLNIYEKFPNYDDLRLNFYSFAYYGDSMTINGYTMDMDGSVVQLYYKEITVPIYDSGNNISGYKKELAIANEGEEGAIAYSPILSNIYITWNNINSETESDRVCYLTFVNENKTINMGTFASGDLTVSFDGVWYYTTAIYEPYTGYELVYTMDWDSPFNMSKEAFILIFIGISILCFLVMNLFYKPGILDYLIVGLTGLIAYILL